MTWRDWLTQARMLLAMDLLESGHRVTEAAAAAGYFSMSAFAKAFSQLTGENPVAFRQRTARRANDARPHDIDRRRR
jgi:methylphosphotriester-DNA--protein-cysteine methyltransferase